ncbi:uncharacterized protein LOC131627164 [Vicia villosa]|uniref:uncharacterized protein LOC131627164 n=1 Tax=Vicia villosa TaxID=3911 RepID=UPI00273B5663|nr:uncharacterized protein LOC131627164 [Vicia villosa]
MMLYTALDVASHPDTRQLAGYLSLLQIYEHFPKKSERKIQHVAASDPCAKRWKAKQAIPGGLIEYKRRIDALTLDDVIWTPYTAHCPHRPFEAHAGGIDQWFQSHIINSPHEIIDIAIKVQEPGQCEDGYLEWFHSMSHPRVIPHATSSDVPESSATRNSSDPPPLSPPLAGDQDSRLKYITVHLDSLMSLVNPDCEVHTILARLADVSRGGPM